MMDWTALVTDELLVLKRSGVEFDAAWSLAVGKHRPPLRAQAVGDGLTTLFDLDGSVPDDEPLVDFVRRVADDAWHGRRPALGHLRDVVEELFEDWSEPAERVSGSKRVLARGRVAA